jgi:hypothetical protein
MDILETIWLEYGKRIITCGELSDILKRCGYAKREISSIVREAIYRRKVGVVSFRKLRRKPPPQSIIVII